MKAIIGLAMGLALGVTGCGGGSSAADTLACVQAVERVSDMEDASDLENKVAMEALSDKERKAAKVRVEAFDERKDEIFELTSSAQDDITSPESEKALDRAKALLAEVDAATEKACE